MLKLILNTDIDKKVTITLTKRSESEEGTLKKSL